MMKNLPLILAFFCCLNGQAQVLGIYNLVDNLVTADHPNCALADNNYVVGMPNDSIWVNIAANDIMQGFFSSEWVDGTGNELIIESGFNADEMTVRLILADDSFSAPHNVGLADWEFQGQVLWSYVFPGEFCTEGLGTFDQSIVALDFGGDFGLDATDIVKGIEITFLAPDADVDLAGVYITDLAQDTQVGIAETELGELSYYPNPFHETFNVQVDNFGSFYQLAVHDLLGNLMYSEFTSNSAIEINSSAWSPGVYLMRVGGRVHKVVKD